MTDGSKVWRCLVCGYVHNDEQPPSECPVCGAARSDFQAFVEEPAPAPQPTTRQWRCLICLYIHNGPSAPETCPVCGAAASRFEPVEPPSPRRSGAPIGHIVVLGAGIAGVSAVETIHRISPSTKITLVSREPDIPYYRLNLTRYLANEIDEMALPIHPADWYQTAGIDLLCGAEASEIRTQDKAVVLRSGDRIRYDKLVLTAGSHPFLPPVPGNQREGVRTLRSWHDARRIIGALKTGMPCICIGGGVLGVETAAALARRGARVTLLEGSNWLMPRQLSEPASRRLAAYVAGLGVHLKTAAKVKEILGDERVGGVLLEDGTVLPADLVLFTTGVRTNSFLARKAGLTVSSGVVVDDHLRTSDPDIFAAGDIAEHRGTVYGLWAPAQYMGTIAGSNAAGVPMQFAGIPRSNTLKVVGLDMFSIGRFEPQDAADRVLENDGDSGYARFVFRDNHLVGAIILGDTSMAAAISKAITDQVDMSTLLSGHPSTADVLTWLR